ncbi:MAG: alpha/beta hydrolase [Solirubrobacteraceae bacterium]|nr:alpha/beta hydrolase [Solirubrobacteraceae bacterium]
MVAVKLRDGRQLGYADWGNSGASAVFYFHGAVGSPMRRCAATDEALAALGIRYVLAHRPGFGLSDPQPGRTLGSWADDVAELADALDIERFAVLGVSAGAPYAAACAHRLGGRVTATGFVSGLTPEGVTFPLRVLRRAPRAGRAVLGTAVHGVRAQPRLLVAGLNARNGRADAAALADPEARAVFLESFLAATDRGVRPMIEDFLLAAGPWGFAPADVRQPVELWHGVGDTTVPVAHARALADALPDCRATFAEREGHFFFRSRMTEILGALVSRRLTGLAPHEPERRAAAGQRDRLAHDEAMTRVEGDVRLLGGLEVAREAVAVGQRQARPEQR